MLALNALQPPSDGRINNTYRRISTLNILAAANRLVLRLQNESVDYPRSVQITPVCGRYIKLGQK